MPFDATGQDAAIGDSLPAHMRYFDGGPTRFLIAQSGRFWHANVEYVKTSGELAPGIRLIATNSPYMGYFSCYPNKSFVEGQFDEAHTDCKNSGLPELSLSLQTPAGQALIVGCSHTGVSAIVRETQKVTADSIALLYGGFHLLPFDRRQTYGLIRELKDELRIRRVAPAHCTGHLAFKLLMEAYGADYLYAGLGETVGF